MNISSMNNCVLLLTRIGSCNQRLVGDKAYDSNPLDEKLQQRGIEMMAPQRGNRKMKKTQDGRKLRRYKRRWKVEDLLANLTK